MPPQSDAELVVAFVSGDESAFNEIFQRYGSLVYAASFRSLGDRTQSEEIMANVFSHAAKRLSALRDPAKLRAWLFAVTSSEVNHLLRSVIRERRRRERAASMRVDDASERFDEAGYAAEVFELARGSLSPDDRVLLGLVLADVSNEELAQALNIEIGAANTRKSRLYDRLRSTIEVYWIARPRPERCADLGSLLAGRREQPFSRTTCRAIDRHVKNCDICTEERERVNPFALLGAAAVPNFVPHPTWNVEFFAWRDPHGVSSWAADGFPRPAHVALYRRRPYHVAAAALTVIVIAGIALGIGLTAYKTNADLSRAAASQDHVEGSSTDLPPPTTTLGGVPSSGASKATTITTTSPAHAPLVHPGTTKHKSTHKTHAGTHPHPSPSSTTTSLPPTSSSVTTTSSSTSTTVIATSLVIDSGPVNFGQSATSETVSFHASGGTTTWSALTSSSWFTVQPASGAISPGSEETLTISMNRANAPSGSLQSTLTISSSLGTAVAQIQATEAAAPTLSSLAVSPNPISCGGQASASAVVSAPAGVKSATLSYTESSGATTSEPMTLLSSGTYGATIHPSTCRSQSISWLATVVDQDGKSASAAGPPLAVNS